MKRVTTTSHDDLPDDPLRYHGDQAAVDAELDFAVNVQADTPPGWLREVVAEGVDKLGSYPDHQLHREATAAVAAWHGVSPDQVLLLNGAAEGFSLLTKLRPAWPVIIHPGFTEPEACLVEAGIDVDRVILTPPFDLDRAVEVLGFGGVHDEADLVVIGNPTNPTGRLYPVEELSRLAEPWRHLVVDEAFLDVSEGQSMISRVGELPGLIVLRSLTKTWSLAGLRCGYLISDRETVARLAGGRPRWPLGTLQLLAIRAVMEPGGRGETELPGISGRIASDRETMVLALQAAGFTVHPSAAPYLLVQPPGGAQAADRLRLGLAARGITVRRCDTFPGLDSGFWRLAVREPAKVATLLQTIDELKPTHNDQESNP
ncbi:Threonine-phosphate decarboxylase [Corynebacterium faecale]|uniref:Rv2231c family pyridoxal phosphate-dependent protein CobC n=1 Tax=Corynebacterium faecale TaxID=1758466 RepID=UPI0025B3B578|nr:Rv2231c family pyridoxal phosphate-dependent protein CobC [Corynebacterium faecale]WJY92767.1 Threonine-phosphate decarboxylase [Corynebacterium faecale]